VKIRGSEHALPLGLLLALNLLAGCVLGGFFFSQRALHHDNEALYSVFRDNNHSLNFFGDVMLWNPATILGFPTFYFSHLGTNTFTPLHVVVMSGSWVLGRLGIVVSDWVYIYLFYVCFLVPLLFSTGAYLLTCQFFRARSIRIYCVVLCSFSPGVVFNLSDNGLEQSAYGMFFAAAFLRYYDRPCLASFLWLICAAATVALAFNHLALYWNLPFLVLFMISVIVFRKGGAGPGLAKAFRAVRLRLWLVSALVVGACFVPMLITYSQGGDILRTRNQERWYSFDYLRHGNPMELLIASTPGLVMNWIEEWHWAIRRYPNPSSAYNYTGALVLPLFLVGICVGRDPWRSRILFLVAAFSLIVCLQGWSAAFATVLAWSTPLRAVNHFCDTSFRNGLFFLLILGSGLGLEVVTRPDPRLRALLPATLLATFGAGLPVLLHLYGAEFLGHPLLGFHVAIVGLVLVLSIRFTVRGRRRERRSFLFALIALSVVDVSTVSFMHVRTVMWHVKPFPPDPAPGTLPSPVGERGDHARTLLMLRQNFRLMNAGITAEQVGSLPYVALFDVITTMKPEDASKLDFKKPTTLVLDPDEPTARHFAEFSKPGPRTFTRPPTVRRTHRDYNQFVFEVDAEVPLILFLKDCNFPGWSATVDGEAAPIVTAFWSFKSVKVPAGKSLVRFTYSQTGLLTSFVLAYAAVIALFVSGCVARLRARA
jgi:hypothetical protein